MSVLDNACSAFAFNSSSVTAVLVILCIFEISKLYVGIFSSSSSIFTVGILSSSVIFYAFTVPLDTFIVYVPVVFNVNVATIDKSAWGKLLFSRVLNTGFSQIDIGGTWGARFYTFVGFIFIDWGVLGVILFGVFWGLYFFERRVHRSVYKISDLFLIFYYYRFLLKGGLVIGSAFLQDAIFAGATYLFIKYFIERTNFPSIMFGDKRIL